MRVLLVQGSTYVPSLGGANKANRLLLEQLAARGHDCRVIGTAGERTVTAERCREELAAAGVADISAADDGVVAFRHAGVAVEAVLDAARLRARVADRIREIQPDRVLVSSEDPAQSLLRAALDAAPDRVVYIAHTTLHLPFGPDGFLASPAGTDLLRRAAGIIAVSRFVQGYLRQWAGLESTLLRFPVYGDGPFPDLGSFDRGFVTLINPCAVKGIAIFLELARRCPDVAFAAVPTWGTTAEDLAALAALPNVEILPPTPAIDGLYARIRVLLAPSLWGEAFGQVAVEAMLRGIPVLASDAGGLPEAALGMDYVLPVSPIQRYEERFDDRRIPVAVVPPQDLGPWERALREVLGDRSRYETLARESRQAAHGFVADLGIAPFEEFLEKLEKLPTATAPASKADGVRSKLEGLSPEKLELLARRLRKKDGAPAAMPAATPAIPRRPRSGGRDVFPVSFAQQRLWFLDRFEAGSPFYNEYFAIRISGRLDTRGLEAALETIVRRHEVLRTTFSETDGEPFQVIQPAGEVRLPVLDLRGLPPAIRKTEAERVSILESLRPFDLERGPVLRIFLLLLEPAEHLLLIVTHHIVADNWSAGVLFGELAALCGSTEVSPALPALPELPVQYADFSVWQRERLGGEALAPQLAYWRRQLAGVPPVLELPADRPRPAKQSFRGARAQSVLPPALTEALRTCARRHDTTLYMLLLAAVQALLHRLTGQEDVVVGTPVAGRLRRELEPLIGFFLNSLPMRGRLTPGLSFAGLLDRSRRAVLEAFAHQEVPFERLVDELVPERNLSHAPLFQVLLNLLNLPARTRELSGALLTPIPVEVGTTKFDLELYLQEIGDVLTVKLLYNTDLFDATTAARLLRHFAVLVAGAAADPGDAVAALPLLTAEEAHQLLVEGNDTAVPLSGSCVHELVAAQARRTPEAVAVAHGGTQLTYRELMERAWRLAQHLRRLGVAPDELVGVSLERSPEMVVALLGVLAAGGAYLPLDPSYPRQRLAMVLEDARPRVLLTSERLETELFPGLAVPVLRVDADREAIGRRPAEPPDFASPGPESLAYVLFTSGSTGRPKGVEVPHRALVNFLRSMGEAPGFPAGGRLLAVTSLSFDIAALEIFLPLLAGGCVELAGRDEAADGAWLAARLAEGGGERVHALQATPATWRMLLDAGWEGDSGLVALCGGEALPRSLAADLAGRAGALWNLYGPTETTVWSAVCRIAPGEDGPVSIGRPIGNTRLHLLDRDLRPVPAGVAGEVCIGGAGLARGYRGRPDLTAERFVPDSREPGARLYRTGDLARYLEGGRGIEVLGRLDHQVKLRGFRIELGEIEAALARHPAVREAVVAVRRDHAGEPRLTAWVVPVNGAIPVSGLRAWLASTLPEHMLPAAFVPLSELPLTPNRKVDRNALPAPDRTAPAAGSEAAGPAGAVEEMLAGIWSDLLYVDRVGAGDDFFVLGGHSLLATRLVSRIRRAFGVELPVRAVFEAPRLAGLARRIEKAIAEGVAPRRPPIEPVSHVGAIPLSFAQQRLWYLDQLDPVSAEFNIAAAVRLEGRLDPVALEAALGEIERRHEILRTTFPTVADVPAQVIAPAAALRLPRVDLSGLPAPAREAECRRLAGEETRTHFDLIRGPVWRTTLIRLGADDHAILLTLHHITSDAWSLGVLVREMGALYAAFSRGLPSPLPEPPIQFADFAAWQRRWLDGEELAPELAYWRERLAGAPALVLPTDFPRRPAEPVRPACQPIVVDPDVARGLAALARAGSATLFMAVLAAFKAVLAAQTGRYDLVVGTNVANRNRLDTEGLIGFFVNFLVLRTDLSGDPTFEELLHRVREVSMGAYAHQDLPFDRLVYELESSRSAGRTPLFQIKVDLQPAGPPMELSELRLRLLDSDKIVARYDLHLVLTEAEGGLLGNLIYDAGLFSAATVGRLGARFSRLLAEAVRTPGARLSELARRLEAAEAAEQQERRQALGRANLANLRQVRRRPVPGAEPASSLETET